MLDTCICSFIMREHPAAVLQRLADVASTNNQIVISAITYAEMRYGQIGKKASPKHKTLVDEFVKRLHEVLPWDQAAVDATVKVKTELTKAGLVIGENDIAIAGHAIAADCVVLTNNIREFSRVSGLSYEDWVRSGK
ncbi:type II toxin-antitoxin system VapC family toxin [Undibacterium sp. RTI2.1]|uniref:type II toxin-antitoxin system VapC family toxin n=1 Tax=unclassified Undibacterium TaxID=2630295 RepID=UPI002B22501E|nr:MULTISPECIES: type II toxin-antitoxin system VapC family toxin [unclassified Undibacterium]MEB0033250.1 type II toxin-antitoxin system VapC family toxin [Undibacterium sp. RTI2.1]MEB0118736.1 type II toxin-antitoxin system VapC family toxin [Undibacterium sp. RTI2.2]